MRRVCSAFVVMLVAVGSCPAQEATKKAAAPGRAEDEKALKALVDRFVKAFNAGDAAAAAATYTETAVVVSEEGDRIEGRAEIKERYAASFADNPGGKITVTADSLKFLGPETAIEEGRAVIIPPKGGSPEHSRFTAVYVKQDGRWLQAAVRDEPSDEATPHDHLKELEWMVGEWVNESDDAVVLTTCKWADGGNFLVRDFTVKTKGRPVLSGTQRIGWDPSRKQFKTWVFDSEGGHGEGYWSRIGDEWTLKVEGVRRDGLHVSAKNTISRLGKDRVLWRSSDRTLGGASIPIVDEYNLVRKAPEVGK